MAIDWLLKKGYAPKHIILEPTFKLGHKQQVYGDILVLKPDFTNLILIENKTHGKEFNKEWNRTLQDGGQLFGYYAVNRTDFLCLLSFDYDDNVEPKISYKSHIICMKDNDTHLKNINANLKDGEKKLGFSDPENANAKDYFRVWRDIYSSAYTTSGLFENSVEKYHVGKDKFKIEDLRAVPYGEIRGIYHDFATILRNNAIGNYENTFYILVDLFLCKIVDELKNRENLGFNYRGVAYDSPFDYCDRLLNLYEIGIEKLFNKRVVNVKKSEIGELFTKSKRHDGEFRKDLEIIFDKQKYFNIKKFNFIEVENEKEFYLNFKVLTQVANLIQDFRISESENNQFLGDLFESFLNRSVHQTEGRFFTPTPITNFIINSLPAIAPNAKILDFACGAGHFLTEILNHTKNVRLYGIEKNKDLSKVAKTACLLHSHENASTIIFQDALDLIDGRHEEDFADASFDVILSNPPYSVKGFLGNLDERARKRFTLNGEVGTKSHEKNNAIECFFIERSAQFLKEGGILALVLPVSILSRDGIYEKTREILLSSFEILALVELNSRTFGSTGTQTIILFARRVKRYDKDLIENLEGAAFNGESLKNDFKDSDLLQHYCAFMGYECEDFRAFMGEKKLSDELRSTETFQAYLAPTTKQKQISLEDMQELEREKMLYFSHIQHSEVLILKSPSEKTKDKKSNKANILRFLGYDWSGRKGDEGIKYIATKSSEPSDDLDDPQDEALKNINSAKFIDTPLYNPSDKGDKSKIAYAFRCFMEAAHPNLVANPAQNPAQNLASPNNDNFAALLDALQPKEEDSYSLFTSPLRDMLDFSKAEFDKAISLNPRGARANPFAGEYGLVRLGEIIEENPKSKIQVNEAKENKSGIYPFYTSGSNIYRYDEFLIDGENIYLSTGGNAIVQFYNGKSAYSTDTYVIKSNNPAKALTKFLFYMLEMQISHINEFLFKGAGLPHLQKKDFKNLKIPLPPLAIQQQIVAECEKVEEQYRVVRMTIEEYQRLIKAVLVKCGICKAESLEFANNADALNATAGGGSDKNTAETHRESKAPSESGESKTSQAPGESSESIESSESHAAATPHANAAPRTPRPAFRRLDSIDAFISALLTHIAALEAGLDWDLFAQQDLAAQNSDSLTNKRHSWANESDLKPSKRHSEAWSEESKELNALLATLPTPPNEGWERRKLWEICEIDWGNTDLTKSIYKDDGVYFAYSASGQDGKVDFFENEGEAIVLSAIGARCGKCFYATGKWTAIKNTITIKPLQEKAATKFVFYCVNNESFWEKSGSAQPFIKLSSANNQKIPLPPLSAQTQITAAIETIEAKISQLSPALEGLEAKKRAILTAALGV